MPTVGEMMGLHMERRQMKLLYRMHHVCNCDMHQRNMPALRSFGQLQLFHNMFVSLSFFHEIQTKKLVKQFSEVNQETDSEERPKEIKVMQQIPRDKVKVSSADSFPLSLSF